MKKKVSHDKEHNIVAVTWFKKGEEHIGVSEELNLLGVTIVIDRNKKGEVRALEII